MIFRLIPDLQKVENRVNANKYSKLSEYVGDVVRIFENCRLFNQPNTPVAKCSEALEAFFGQKLKLLRDRENLIARKAAGTGKGKGKYTKEDKLD